MFAMASSFDRDYVASAKKRELSKRVISLEIVHYLLLVVIHCQGTSRSVQAWNNHGLVIRSAIALGLHSESTGRAIDHVQEEYRRRTWAVIYCLDKVLSVAFGRPSSIPDEQMTRREPVSGLTPLAANGTHGNVDLPGEFLAVSVRLYQVMSKSLIDQYGANLENADSDPDDIASLKASGELRKTLQIWAASLPSYLRLCEPNSNILSQNSQANRFRVILTLRHHNLSILIHKPLLSATIRHLFRAESAAGGSPPYLLQLAMAEAHECIRSAQLTIEVVHSVISTDPTSKNNLGAWYFTLYYGESSLNGRLLWAQHGQNVVDEAAVSHSKTLLDKAETIFQKLDHENNLRECAVSKVSNCHSYLLIANSEQLVDKVPGAAPNACEGRSETASTLNHALSDNQSTGLVGTRALTVEDMEALQRFTSEMFDPSIFEGFEQSPVDGIAFANGLWEGFNGGGR
ncbi:Transcription factor FBD3 [Neocucurbitaria cava]|uniref:Transcription factor FBD3 n=1 Tax=Neocucurbitaria cava TaxID=798079 RepID=A0A9W8YCV8_9PLEO|nr:Transcription factor FBD3 [Neocucurbitaria cava]